MAMLYLSRKLIRVKVVIIYKLNYLKEHII
jgi:hypothetical protein